MPSGHDGPCAAVRAGAFDLISKAVAKEREQGRRREHKLQQRIAELEARVATLLRNERRGFRRR